MRWQTTGGRCSQCSAVVQACLLLPDLMAPPGLYLVRATCEYNGADAVTRERHIEAGNADRVKVQDAWVQRQRRQRAACYDDALEAAEDRAHCQAGVQAATRKVVAGISQSQAGGGGWLLV